MIGVGLIALCTLFFEVTLTRIFAVTLWYHFGFLAISLALLGTAASAVACFLWPEQLAGEGHLRVMSGAALGFAVLAPFSVAFHISVRLPPHDQLMAFFLSFGAQLTLLFAAFFCAGLCISVALFRYASRVGTVYFFDLIGAALGSLLVVPLLYELSGLALVFLVSTGAAAAAATLAGPRSRRRRVGAVLAVACVGLALVNDSAGILEIHTIKSYGKGTVQAEEDDIVFEKWSPVARVVVHEPRKSKRSGLTLMKVTNNGGAPTTLWEFGGDYSKAGYTTKDSRQVAHALKRDADVLVIGSAGGADVLAALAADQSSVTAVEINPVTAELVTEHYADYIGNIFTDPRVTLHVQEGRNFVAGSPDTYDLIQITMIDSWGGAAAGAYVFNENNLYTLEAVDDYVSHLKPDGILAMTRYYKWDEALRLLNTFATYLHGQGLHDVRRRVAVVLERSKRYRRATILLKNGVFTDVEVEALAARTERSNATLLYAPGVADDELHPGKTAERFRTIVAADDDERRRIVAEHRRNIAPSTDDQPFFFFNARLADVLDPNPKDHPARRLALPMLYGMVATLLVLALTTIILPLYLRAGTAIARAPFRNSSLLYFAMLGVGFMLVEISLIQRLTVFLGHPIWSFVVVLATMLAFGGLGSFYSNRWGASPRHLVGVLATIVGVMLVYVALVYDAFIGLMWLGKASRIALAVAATAPPAFAMGMCFPMGVQIVRGFHPTLIPWGWGINGAFSVFASVASIVIALNAGFKAALATGALCYAIALGVALVWKRRVGAT